MILRRILHLFSLYSLRSKILVNLVLFTLIPFVITSVIIIFYAKYYAVNSYKAEIKVELNRCEHLINRELYLYHQKASFIATNPRIQKNLKVADFANDPQKIIDFQDFMKALLYDVEANETRAGKFTIYLDNYDGYKGAYLKSLNEFNDVKTSDTILGAASSEVIWNPKTTINSYGSYITFYRNLTPITGRKVILEVNIPYRIIHDHIENIKIPGCLPAIKHQNSYGTVIYENSQSKDIKNLNTGNYLIQKIEHLYDGSKITLTIPWSVINKQYYRVLLILFLLFLIIVAVIIAASSFTVGRITRSFNNFISYLKKNDDVLMDERLINVQEKDEVAIIKQRFIGVLRRLNEIYRDLMDIKNRKNMLEIELLQAQINPHLLYNSLSVIKWAAIKKSDKLTEDIVKAMTNYYRIALNKGNYIIEISEELNMVKEYVYIVNFTHSNKYTLNIDVDEEVNSHYALKHLLQPLIENSVLHGLNGKSGDGLINVRGHKKNGMIIFEVSDNGYGMDEETINKLLNFNYKSNYGGYAIKNLIMRIRNYYGENCGLEITSEKDRGTTVTVRVKALSKEELEEKFS